MTFDEPVEVSCPYCGEPFSTRVDTSAGNQQYIEDCQVCCRPIEFRALVDDAGQLIDLQLRREDE